MIDDVMADTKSRMGKSVEVLSDDLSAIRTARASVGLVKNLKVDYYGSETLLNQLATISTPEARLLVIQPWDKDVIKPVEKAILRSDLGLNPSSDGKVIRLVIPQLTEERRQELAKIVRKRVEDGRVAVRNIRRDAHEELRSYEHNHDISQDDLRRAEGRLQKLTDEAIEQLDRLGIDKEQEVLAV